MGIVLSVLWINFTLAIALGQYNHTGKGEFIGTIPGKVLPCPSIPTKAPDTQPGSNKRLLSMEEVFGPNACSAPEQHYFKFGALFAFAVAPVLLTWLFAYTLVAVIRWVGAGFKGKAT